MSCKGRWGAEVALLAVVLGLGAGCGGVEAPSEAPLVGRAEQATRGFLPDLTAEELTRDGNYYRVKYCNRTSYSVGSDFTISLRNELTGQSFNFIRRYPDNVPAPGTCQWTGGITCGLVGMVCDEAGTLTATVDSLQEVTESYEFNNELTVQFPQQLVRPDLVVEEVVRTSSAYHARFCNRGNSGSSANVFVDFRNQVTNASYTPPTPRAVPAPGQCGWTEGVPCFWLGGSCSDTVELSVSVDPGQSVLELDEDNNTLLADFTPASALPDLVASDLWREGDSLFVSFCNQGSGTSSTRFTVKLTNLTTWLSFRAVLDAPFAVPAPGTCGTTGPISCDLVGCNSTLLRALVDDGFMVFEPNEANNVLERAL